MIVTEKKELRLPTPKYCESIHQTRRRPTRTIDVRGGGASLCGQSGELASSWSRLARRKAHRRCCAAAAFLVTCLALPNCPSALPTADLAAAVLLCWGPGQ